MALKIARLTSVILYEVNCPHCEDPLEPDGIYGDGFTRARLANLRERVICQTCDEVFRLPKRLPRPTA